MEISQLERIEKVAGDTLIQSVTVTESDSDGMKDLDGATAEWALLRKPSDQSVITDGDDDVDIEIDTDSSVVTVEVSSGATEGFDGMYVQRLRLIDVHGERRTYVGDIDIDDYD